MSEGWGTPGYQPPRPDAPAPGPVPVRPMQLGELLDAAFKLLRADFGQLLLAVGVIVVPTQILTTILAASLGTSVFSGLQQNPEAIDDILTDIGADTVGFVLGTVLVTVIAAILILLAEAAVIRIGAARYLGGSEGAAAALSLAGRKAGAIIGARVLATLGAVLPAVIAFVLAAVAFAAGQEVIGAVLIAVGAGLTVYGIYLYVRWILSPAAIMLENAGAGASLRRSAQLVSGRWWTVFGYLIVAGIVIGIVGLAVGGVFSAIGSLFPDAWYGWVLTGAGAILTALITEPVSALITFLLYADARVRKEALDLQIQAVHGEPWPRQGRAQWNQGASPG